MSEKFTPGEWEVFHHKDEFSKSFDWREIVTKDTPPKAIVHMMYYDGMSQEEYEANAALLAAAPKMYQRLQSVKTDLWALSVNPAISVQTKECIDIIIKNIEGDLKKARGEE